MDTWLAIGFDGGCSKAYMLLRASALSRGRTLGRQCGQSCVVAARATPGLSLPGYTVAGGVSPRGRSRGRESGSEKEAAEGVSSLVDKAMEACGVEARALRSLLKRPLQELLLATEAGAADTRRELPLADVGSLLLMATGKEGRMAAPAAQKTIRNKVIITAAASKACLVLSHQQDPGRQRGGDLLCVQLARGWRRPQEYCMERRRLRRQRQGPCARLVVSPGRLGFRLPRLQASRLQASGSAGRRPRMPPRAPQRRPAPAARRGLAAAPSHAEDGQEAPPGLHRGDPFRPDRPEGHGRHSGPEAHGLRQLWWQLWFDLDENGLSNPEVIRDFATIANWRGCDLVPDSPRCAPKTALQFPVHGGHACSFEGRVVFAAGLPRWRNCAAPASPVQ